VRVTNSFVDFYDERGIIPVNQRDAATIQHYLRRKRLYGSLGIPMEHLSGLNILEVGGGSGDNAQIVLGFNPQRYVFLDSSKTALERLNSRFAREINHGTVQLLHGDMNNFESHEKFDLVIAEGCIPGQVDPINALKNIVRLVSQSGYLIFTVQSAASLLSEILRRILALQIRNYSNDEQEWVEDCITMFSSTLVELKGMSRLFQDWVFDVLIHPWHHGSQVFEFNSAYSLLNRDFELLGISPSWVVRDSWYKEDTGEISILQSRAFETYGLTSPFFLDRNFSAASATTVRVEDSEEIARISHRIYEVHLQSSQSQYVTKNQLEIIFDYIVELSKLIRPYNSELAITLSEFLTISSELSLSYDRTRDYFIGTNFLKWWGRGQQYCAYQRANGASMIT